MKTKYLTAEELKEQVENLVKFKNELRTLYASFDKKKLYIDGHGGFIVVVDGKEKQFMQPFSAIEYLFES